MAKLVELYMMDGYEGLHEFETAKKIIWQSRGFYRLDKSWTKEQLMREQEIDVINEALKSGRIVKVLQKEETHC